MEPIETTLPESPIAAEVLKICAKGFGFGTAVGILTGRGRDRQMVNARKVACYILQKKGFTGRDCALTFKRGERCSNMVASWIFDVQNDAHLLHLANRYMTQLDGQRLTASEISYIIWSLPGTSQDESTIIAKLQALIPA